MCILIAKSFLFSKRSSLFYNRLLRSVFITRCVHVILIERSLHVLFGQSVTTLVPFFQETYGEGTHRVGSVSQRERFSVSVVIAHYDVTELSVFLGDMDLYVAAALVRLYVGLG